MGHSIDFENLACCRIFVLCLLIYGTYFGYIVFQQLEQGMGVRLVNIFPFHQIRGQIKDYGKGQGGNYRFAYNVD